MEKANFQHVSISEFYKGKNVFITGATGFLGKVLIEKLLRCCPDIGYLYVLIRPKKGNNIEERLKCLTNDQLFDVLKETCPSQLSKLIPVHGDCAELNLGLSTEDYQTIISSVSVIYHVAASVRFDDPLKKAILLNTRGTREVAHLALKTTNLSVFVHVSTTYCNCVVGKTVKEQMYPAPDDWRKAIEIAEKFDAATLNILADKYLGPYPNTYTFAKSLGEHVVQDLCKGKIPTIICRPSIVISTLNDPVAGWIDNLNGPVGLLVACGKGLLRNSYMDPDISPDYIPVDIVVKMIIVSSWDLGLRQQKEQVEIVQCSTGKYKWITLGKLISTCKELACDYPLNDAIWVPKGFIYRCLPYTYLCTILFQLLPALFLDLGLKLANKKPMLMTLQKKMFHASLQLRYFSWQEWYFSNDKMLALDKKILDTDRKVWSFEFKINVDQYMPLYLMGGRKYLLRESDESLPSAKRHYKRMYWLDKICMFILYGSLIWLVMYFRLPQEIASSFYNFVMYLFNRFYFCFLSWLK